MADIDDLISDEEEEKGSKGAPVEQDNSDLYPEPKAEVAEERTEIGEVEQFFSKIGVAAIHLSADLKVGDTIEIDDEDGAVRSKVSEMQIDRKEVAAAFSGDSVGVKLNQEVKPGSKVYRV